jgi:hypothetical protein
MYYSFGRVHAVVRLMSRHRSVIVIGDYPLDKVGDGASNWEQSTPSEMLGAFCYPVRGFPLMNKLSSRQKVL